MRGQYSIATEAEASAACLHTLDAPDEDLSQPDIHLTLQRQL